MTVGAPAGAVADNSAVLTGVIGPLVAVLGLVAVAAVLSTRWRVRRSLYESLREERHRQVEEARRRAGGSHNEPAGAGEPHSGEGEVRAGESLLPSIAGHVALAGALLLILFGVALLVAAAR